VANNIGLNIGTGKKATNKQDMVVRFPRYPAMQLK